MDKKLILKKIGAKLKEVRLEKNMKQSILVEKTGLSLFTISQTETGHNTSLETIILMLDSLDRMDLLEPFFKDASGNPISLTPENKAVRRRVSKSLLKAQEAKAAESGK